MGSARQGGRPVPAPWSTNAAPFRRAACRFGNRRPRFVEELVVDVEEVSLEQFRASLRARRDEFDVGYGELFALVDAASRRHRKDAFFPRTSARRWARPSDCHHRRRGVERDADGAKFLVADGVGVARDAREKKGHLARGGDVRSVERVGGGRGRGVGASHEGADELRHLRERSLARVREAVPVVLEGVDGVETLAETERDGVAVDVVGIGVALAASAPERARGEANGGRGHSRRARGERGALFAVARAPCRRLRLSGGVARHLRTRTSEQRPADILRRREGVVASRRALVVV